MLSAQFCSVQGAEHACELPGVMGRLSPAELGVTDIKFTPVPCTESPISSTIACWAHTEKGARLRLAMQVLIFQSSFKELRAELLGVP